MEKNIILLLLLFYTKFSLSQSTKQSDLEFLKTKIENVYAGYQDKKNEIIINQIIHDIEVSKSKDTFKLLSKLTTYFNDYHVSLFEKGILKKIDSLENKNVNTLLKPKNSNSSYWINEFNNTVICLQKKNKFTYEAFLIESKNEKNKGLKFFTLTKTNSKFWETDFINIGRDYRIFTKSYFKTKDILINGSYEKWRKINNYQEGILKEKHEVFKKPYCKKIDDKNFLISMPAFDGDFIEVYDSLIHANNEAIANSQNLIIDLRNNLGGFTNCFDSILPFVCTENIITSGSEVLSSQDLINNATKDRDSYMKSKDTNMASIYNTYIDSLSIKKGKLMSTGQDTIKFSVKKNQIKNVGIIINYGCRSAAELMLIYLKQSKKVKIFGEPTAGAVDYLSILSYKLPNSKYNLWIGSAKRRLSAQEPSYDAGGIKPDIEIKDSEMDWISFVKKYYEEN